MPLAIVLNAKLLPVIPLKIVPVAAPTLLAVGEPGSEKIVNCTSVVSTIPKIPFVITQVEFM